MLSIRLKIMNAWPSTPGECVKSTTLAMESKKLTGYKRDERLFKSASFLADALEKLNKQAAAMVVLQDLVRLSVSLPSGNLNKMARMRLANLDPSSMDFSKLLDKTGSIADSQSARDRGHGMDRSKTHQAF